MWPRRSPNPDDDHHFPSTPISNEELARVAAELSEALEIQAGGDQRDSVAIIQTFVDFIKGAITDFIVAQRAALSDAFGRGLTRLDQASRDRNIERDAATEAEREKKTADRHLRETRMQVQSSSASRYPLIRLMPTPFYAFLLVIASGAIGMMNSATLRVLGLADNVTFGFAAFTAALYGVAIHILPLGFNRKRWRDPAFWLAFGVISLQLASTVFLSQLRGDYLTILEVSLEPWSIVVLPLLADFVALLAAFIHGSEDAAALRQGRRDVRRASKFYERCVENRAVAENAHSEVHQAMFSDVETRVERIRSVPGHQAKGIFNSFFMRLLTVRPLSASILQDVDVRLPDVEGLEMYDEWLSEQAPLLERPTLEDHRRRPRRSAEEE